MTNLTWPLDDPEHVAAALREQDATEAEIQEWSEALMRLREWQAPHPSADETRHLVERLSAYVPAVSPVRQALRRSSGAPVQAFVHMLRLVRTQVSLLRLSFWVVSAIVIAVGGVLVIGGPNLSQSFVLQMVGPLLSYIGTATAFRAQGVRMVEFELACPPSLRQLTLARLILILSYDLALGFLLTLVLWSFSGSNFWLIALHWLAPLLLGTGLTLLLSLRLPMRLAAGLTYTGWLAALVISLTSQTSLLSGGSALPVAAEAGVLVAGLAMVGGAVALLPQAMPRMLPRH